MIWIFQWSNLDGPVPAGGDDILVVKVDDVHSRSVSNQHPPQVDLGRAHHVPDLRRDQNYNFVSNNC